MTALVLWGMAYCIVEGYFEYCSEHNLGHIPEPPFYQRLLAAPLLLGWIMADIAWRGRGK